MTAPRAVICRLCMDTKALSELSRSASGDITDICLVCRERELRAVLAQVEALLAADEMFVRPKYSDDEITQEVVLKICEHGYVVDGRRNRCHYCEV